MKRVIYNKFDKHSITALPSVTFPGRIVVIVSPGETEKAVDYLLSHDILGVDTETRPSFRRGEMHKVSLLQVSSRDICFLFRLNLTGITPAIKRLLEDTTVKKIGLSWHDDILMLKKREDFKPGLFIDLQDIVGSIGIEDKSLQKLYANIFGQKISKRQRLTNWENDIVMQKDGDCYSVSGVYLTAEDEFKFRANGLWDLNLGGGSLDAVLPNSTVSLWQDGANLKVAEEGYYSFKLYPYEGYVEVIQDLRVVSCANYDEVAAVEDGTYVRVQGYVFGMYGRGFMLNIGNYYRNTILVYTQTKPIDYTPVLGNALDIVALKVTYSGLPELKEVYAYEVLSAEEKDYGYGTGYDLRDPAFFDTVQIDRYDHVRFVGTLQQNGNYWNVVVDGATRIGSISYPLQDLTPYVGQKVMVLGWFCGLSTSGGNTYMNVMLRKILTPSEDGGTEDIIPGDDIVELPEIPQQ